MLCTMAFRAFNILTREGSQLVLCDCTQHKSPFEISLGSVAR
jgi:hypothetical protein